jgi:hypothetical protein
MALLTLGQRMANANSTYKKLAVQRLNGALCFVSSSVLAEIFRIRNRQILVKESLLQIMKKKRR